MMAIPEMQVGLRRACRIERVRIGHQRCVEHRGAGANCQCRASVHCSCVRRAAADLSIGLGEAELDRRDRIEPKRLKYVGVKFGDVTPRVCGERGCESLRISEHLVDHLHDRL